MVVEWLSLGWRFENASVGNGSRHRALGDDFPFVKPCKPCSVCTALFCPLMRHVEALTHGKPSISVCGGVIQVPRPNNLRRAWLSAYQSSPDCHRHPVAKLERHQVQAALAFRRRTARSSRHDQALACHEARQRVQSPSDVNGGEHVGNREGPQTPIHLCPSEKTRMQV
ncbi:hypothetical protein TBK1r_63700 [Stieleria magnilauensis]|uniref:Uncharacterized protein n=1 Tax=Stieleria magnilauensis TaxID=2527963 RepID=A0ABX5Y2B7_9BACT|nr:hypothetical protein TBK1r_63700 [Planctomycetes bacterium TBK1r]